MLPRSALVWVLGATAVGGLVVLAALVVAGPALAQDPTPLRARFLDPPARVRAEASLSTAVALLEEQWPASARDVAEGLGLDHPEELEIVLLSGDTFERWSRGLLPEWGVGFANWPRGPIVLDVGGIARSQKSFGEVLRHEISHVYLGQRLDGVRPPLWFIEGVAQAQSGEWRLGDTFGLVGAASTARLPALDELRQHFPQGGGSAQLAYRIALKAVLELDRRFGDRGGWRAVLDATARGGRFDLAFEEVYGLRQAFFEREVSARLHHRYGWVAAIAGAGSLFSAMTLLFLAGYWRKRGQARRRLREMEEEERRVDRSLTQLP